MGIVATGTPVYQIHYHHAVTKETKQVECVGDKLLKEMKNYLIRRGFILDKEEILFVHGDY